MYCFVKYSKTSSEIIKSEIFSSQEEVHVNRADSDDSGTIDWWTWHSETSSSVAATCQLPPSAAD